MNYLPDEIQDRLELGRKQEISALTKKSKMGIVVGTIDHAKNRELRHKIEQSQEDFNVEMQLFELRSKVTEYYNQEESDVVRDGTKTRKTGVVQVRQRCGWLIKNQIIPNRKSLAEIGFMLGGVKHSTICMGNKRAKGYLKVDKEYRKDMMELIAYLGKVPMWNNETKTLIIL